MSSPLGQFPRAPLTSIDDYDGNPEGLRDGRCSDIIKDPSTGKLYIKTTPQGTTTGWRELTGAVSIYEHDNDVEVRNKRYFIVYTLARLREIRTHPDNLVCDLLGEFSFLDGQLQGRYVALSPDAEIEDDGANYVYSDDGGTLWRKFQ